MASSSGLRISYLLRHQLAPPLVSNRFTRTCLGLSELRFLSTKNSTASRSLRLAKSGRRDEPVKDEGDDGQDGNGSVAVKKDGGGSDGRIVHTALHKEATDAYMAYAMSVLLGRALPDVRDGLKPVHRRILLVIFPSNFFFSLHYLI